LPQALPVLSGLYRDVPERKVAWLASLGYTCLWVTFSAGYAPRDEAPNQEDVRRFAQVAHEHGLRVTAYCSLTNVFWKSYLREMPEARDWLQQGPDGAPNLYGGQPSRYLACINHPAWLDAKRQVARLAADTGADDIFWDNLFNRCHCAHCQAAFATYSASLLGRPHAIPRPASTAVSRDLAPTETAVALLPADDPVYAAWTAFVDQSVAQAIAALRETARSRNPLAITSANAHKARGVDAACDVIWTEDGNYTMPRRDQQGIVSGVAQYRWGEAEGRGRKAVLCMLQPAPASGYWRVCSPDEYRLAIAEGAAFGGAFVPMLGDAIAVRFALADTATREAMEAIREYQRFLASHRELYVGLESVGDVGVFYSGASCARDAARGRIRKPWEFALLALTEANVLSRVLLDRDADAASLAGYRVVVLAGVECLTDIEAERLRAYVCHGGVLVMVGEVGGRSELWERRSAPALADLAPDAGDRGRAAVVWRNSGAGRCAVIVGTPDDDYGSMAMERRDGVMAAALVKAVREARDRPSLIELRGDSGVVVSLARQTVTDRLVLHLLNFDLGRAVDRLGVTLSTQLLCESDNRDIHARFLSPDLSSGSQVLTLEREVEHLHLEVPRLQTYGVIEFMVDEGR